MLAIQKIAIEGLIDTINIFNADGSGEKNGYNNHRFAKVNCFNVDFTSSRCIRHEMYKDLQPRQPMMDEFQKNYLKIAASEIGLIRGIMDADKQLKRTSPLHVSDAYTVVDNIENIDDNSNQNGNYFKYIFSDQGICSRPIPSEKTTEKCKNSEKTKGNLMMFSRDNAHKRKQNLSAFLNIQNLQFIEQGINQDRIVSDDDEKDFIKELQSTFKNFGVSNDIKIENYNFITAVSPTKIRGILLNDEQIIALVKSTISRLAHIDGQKTSSYLKSIRNSFVIKLLIQNEYDYTLAYSIEEFFKLLEKKKFTFVKFYKKV